MTPQPELHNGQKRQEQPRDDLDVTYSIIRPNEYDELLEQINFGTGYYEDAELNMQMRNARRGLFTTIAFSNTLRDHAERETKTKLADEGFRWYDEQKEEVQIWKPIDDADIDDELQVRGRTAILLERGDEIWEELGRPQYSLSVEQAAALEAKANMSNFKPIFNHLAAIYHEQTKSKGARLIDNYFGRVKRQVLKGDDDEDARKLLGRGRET